MWLSLSHMILFCLGFQFFFNFFFIYFSLHELIIKYLRSMLLLTISIVRALLRAGASPRRRRVTRGQRSLAARPGLLGRRRRRPAETTITRRKSGPGEYLPTARTTNVYTIVSGSKKEWTGEKRLSQESPGCLTACTVPTTPTINRNSGKWPLEIIQ